MIKKYANEFEEMYEKIFTKKKSPLNVIGEYVPTFEDEGIGTIGIAHYLGEYISKRE
jgi:hypothetical protein